MEPATETQKSLVGILRDLDMTPPPSGWEEDKIITGTYIDEQVVAMEEE